MNKRGLQVLILIVIMAIATVILFKIAATNMFTKIPETDCSNPGLLVPGAPKLQAMADTSHAIVTGKIKPDEDEHLLIEVEETLKGNTVHKRSQVLVCPVEVDRTRIADNEVLVFLAGKDPDSNYWTLAYPYDGITPIHDEHVDWGSGSYSLDEIRQAINEQK